MILFSTRWSSGRSRLKLLKLPSQMVPLVLDCKQVVLVSDHQQYEPLIMNKIAARWFDAIALRTSGIIGNRPCKCSTPFALVSESPSYCSMGVHYRNVFARKSISRGPLQTSCLPLSHPTVPTSSTICSSLGLFMACTRVLNWLVSMPYQDMDCTMFLKYPANTLGQQCKRCDAIGD